MTRGVRSRLVLTTVAVTAMVTVAFVLPLGWAVQTIASDQALNTTSLHARSVAALVASGVDEDVLLRVLAQANASGGHRTVVVAPDGTTTGAPLALDPATLALGRSGRAFTAEATGGGVAVVPVDRGDQRTVVAVFVPSEELRRGVLRTWLVLGLLGLTLVGLAAVVADRLGQSLVRPIRGLRDVALRLQAGNDDARADGDGPREIVEVGAAVNALADRIDLLLAAERESLADVSHRLRTPLTALRLDAEGLRDPEERARLTAASTGLERSVDVIIEQVRRVPSRPRDSSCDLVAVVRARFAFWAVLAEDQCRSCWLRADPGSTVSVGVASGDLDAAVDALLANVFEHTPEGVAFGVEVAGRTGGGGTLTVDDAGPGLGDGPLLERGISGGGGTGLGLDIVRRLAEGSGGRLDVTRSEQGGARIVVEIGPPGRS